ncbi:MAG: MATE family efflux transporter [Gemmatimonadaceae bacterium]|nr:MATE family efflux transporter [Gemmatimonadaceae bacterium]
MQDLTQGSIPRHLVQTTGFMLVMMVFQTLYFLIDLYWVGRLGTAAVAGVGIAGNVSFIVLAVSQVLAVGATALVAQAVGAKDQPLARRRFNQGLGLAAATGCVFVAVGAVTIGPYARSMSADAATATLAIDYLRWFVPAMALQLPVGVMAASLRATGSFKPVMVLSIISVVVNMALAPFLIFGWGTGIAFGVGGAAIATFVSVVVGSVLAVRLFLPADAYLRFLPAEWRPQWGEWRRMLAVGLPAGFEFAMMALYQFVVYSVARPFGPAAQAGFGVGMRVIQAGFMPVVALGAAVTPVAGQNFGAQRGDRVRATFRSAALMASAVMALFALLSHVAPQAMIGLFTGDPAVIATGTEYLRIISWNYVASGLIFVASAMFQAMGNTVPSLVASGVRMALVIVPVLVLARRPGFELHVVWYLAVATVYLQLAISLVLLRWQFARRLVFTGEARPAAAPAPLAVVLE